MSPDEARLALQALVRRDELEPQARVELFAELAARYRSLVEFPPEITDGLSPEQYVRNVVDILFREKTDHVDYANLAPNYSYGSFPDAQSFARREFLFSTPGGTNDPGTALITFLTDS